MCSHVFIHCFETQVNSPEQTLIRLALDWTTKSLGSEREGERERERERQGRANQTNTV